MTSHLSFTYNELIANDIKQRKYKWRYIFISTYKKDFVENYYFNRSESLAYVFYVNIFVKLGIHRVNYKFVIE